MYKYITLKVTFRKTLTKFLGLTVSIISQLAEKGVLLGEENLHVLHADINDSGSDVGTNCVNTLKNGKKQSSAMKYPLVHKVLPVLL